MLKLQSSKPKILIHDKVIIKPCVRDSNLRGQKSSPFPYQGVDVQRGILSANPQLILSQNVPANQQWTTDQMQQVGSHTRVRMRQQQKLQESIDESLAQHCRQYEKPVQQLKVFSQDPPHKNLDTNRKKQQINQQIMINQDVKLRNNQQFKRSQMLFRTEVGDIYSGEKIVQMSQPPPIVSEPEILIQRAHPQVCNTKNRNVIQLGSEKLTKSVSPNQRKLNLKSELKQQKQSNDQQQQQFDQWCQQQFDDQNVEQMQQQVRLPQKSKNVQSTRDNIQQHQSPRAGQQRKAIPQPSQMTWREVEQMNEEDDEEYFESSEDSEQFEQREIHVQDGFLDECKFKKVSPDQVELFNDQIRVQTDNEALRRIRAMK